MIKCPNCGGTVFADETTDNEWLGDEYRDFVIGERENCHKIYQWEEVFVFNRVEGIKEIVEDED